MGFLPRWKLLARAVPQCAMLRWSTTTGIFPELDLHPTITRSSSASGRSDMSAIHYRLARWFGFLVAFAVLCSAQSDRVTALRVDGAWHLRGHIPLGVETLQLEPSHRF